MNETQLVERVQVNVRKKAREEHHKLHHLTGALLNVQTHTEESFNCSLCWSLTRGLN